MDRCVGCEGSRDVQRIGLLPWCAECRGQDFPELFDSRIAPLFSDAIQAEVRRRRLPVQRNSAEKQTS